MKMKKNLLISNTARSILEETLDPIEGVRKICALRFGTENPDHEVFIALCGIESETDHFVFGEARNSYSPKYLRRIDSERIMYIDAVRGDIFKECRRIIDVFS